MGRIRHKSIKRVGNKLFVTNPKDFSSNFSKNKKVVSEKVEVRSKKLRNVLSGYMVKLSNKSKKAASGVRRPKKKIFSGSRRRGGSGRRNKRR